MMSGRRREGGGPHVIQSWDEVQALECGMKGLPCP